VVLALAAVPAFADEVHLRGGGRVTGEIVEQTEESITVDIGGGTLTVRTSSVVGIEKSVSPMQEYRARAAELPAGDAEAWRELAGWATGNALASQATDAWNHVVEILPDDEEANRALGRVRLDGRWVSEEESYRARGYVEFEGAWMTHAERQSILAGRAAREEAERQAIDAEVRAIEAELEAERRREEAEAEAFHRGGLPQYGDPVYWGWGAGPTTWPATPQNQAYELSGSVGRQQ
jgi:hypothetical protein